MTRLDSAPEKQQLRVQTQSRREGSGKDGAGRAADSHTSETLQHPLAHLSIRWMGERELMFSRERGT